MQPSYLTWIQSVDISPQARQSAENSGKNVKCVILYNKHIFFCQPMMKPREKEEGLWHLEVSAATPTPASPRGSLNWCNLRAMPEPAIWAQSAGI